MSQKNILPLLFLTLLLDVIGLGMLFPIIPALFTDASSPSFVLHGYSHNMQYFFAGLTTAVFGVMQFLASPFLGELSDIHGRKKLLLLGVGVLALSNAVFAFGISIGSLVLIIGSRAVAGVAGANFSIAQAAIADVTPPELRARNFGLIGAAFGLGFVIGPLLGGVITALSGNPAVPFYFASLLGLCNVTMVYFIFPETHPTSTSDKKITVLKAFHNIRDALEDVDVRGIYLVGFLGMLGFSFFTSFVTVYLVERFAFSESMTGTFFAAVGVWIIISQAVLVRFVTARASEISILTVALPVLATVIAIYPFVGNSFYLYFTMPFMAGSIALISTCVPSLVSKGVDADKQGAALGINGSLQALTGGIAPLAAGFASSFLGLTGAFLIGAAVVVVALVVLIATRPATVRA